jgi:3-oxoacyl-[acyl-carrier-protein] synthase-3
MEQSQLNDQAQTCLQALMRIWFEFERNLNKVDIIRRLENGQFTTEDYQLLLLNLRQQVIEGSRWITRGASSFNRDFADIRSVVIGHAQEEHRDYEMLEKDFVAAGGNLHDIQSRARNVGSEALHAFLMYRASHKNPIDLIGAMWIIEGLGQKMADSWASRIEELLELPDALSFMRYHSENDTAHMQKLYEMLNRVCTDSEVSERIQKTARVVARLYLLQLEEIDA